MILSQTKMLNNFIFLILIFGCWIASSTHTQAQIWEVTEMAAMPEPVSNNAVCEGFVNGVPYVYSFGGIDTTKTHSGIHLRSYRYNTQTDIWESIAPLPDTLGKIAAGASRIGNIIYIIGGYHVFQGGNETSSNRVHRYDVNQNIYLSDGTPIPVPIDDQVQDVWRDSLIFVITGWSDFANVPDVQIYNPMFDSWSQGTSLPDNNFYKSFGSSGVIIGDTIYYFGGASMGFNFPIQPYLRKGVINPSNPTQVTWSDTTWDNSITGYRMAATSIEGNAFWIGGSETTYNFNGIAYNGTGGVSPSERSIVYNVSQDTLAVENNYPDIPMDLRGVAETGPLTRYIAGGMEHRQKVTDITLRLEADLVLGIEENVFQTTGFEVYPNPASSFIQLHYQGKINRHSEIIILDMLGRSVSHFTINDSNQLIDISHLFSGIYFLYDTGSGTTTTLAIK